MKKSLILLLMVSFFILSLTMETKETKSLLPNKKVTQVAIVVKDIEKSANLWTKFLGLNEVPEIRPLEKNELNPTLYKGEPSDAGLMMCFFELDNLTIELLQPLGEGQSTWRDFLETNGEGIHHIAFNVKGMKTHIANFEGNNIPMIQHGGWDGGEYSYMDGTASLGIIVELLEHYNE